MDGCYICCTVIPGKVRRNNKIVVVDDVAVDVVFVDDVFLVGGFNPFEKY